jgi:hypothetical protein
MSTVCEKLRSCHDSKGYADEGANNDCELSEHGGLCDLKQSSILYSRHSGMQIV